MPRFRNTTSSVAMDEPNLEHAITTTKDVSYLSRLSHAFKDSCTSPDLTQPHTLIPTPSPSPISPSVALPSSNSTESSKPPKRKHAARTQDANHIPRPRNAFILFRSHALANGLVCTTQQNEASREIARIWRTADAATRKHFEDRAVEEKRRHAETYPGYKYAPKKVGAATPMAAGSEKVKTTVTSMGTEGRKVQTRTSVRFCPMPTKAKRTLLTPEPTPEPSPSLSHAPLDVEHGEPCGTDEDFEDDGYPFNMFESLPKSMSESADSQESKIPEFTFPLEDEEFTIDQGRVPCLASSAFYNPTFVHSDRRLRHSAGYDLRTIEEDELIRRALRPSAPLWHAEAKWRSWDGTDVSSPGPESVQAPAAAATVDAMDVISETMSMSMFINDSF